MGVDAITFGNIQAITQSDFANAQYHFVSRSIPPSPYWQRLTSLPSFRGLTQVQIVKKVTRITGESYGQTGVQKWKSGKSEPPVSISRQLAANDGYSAEWLISGQGDPLPPGSALAVREETGRYDPWPFPFPPARWHQVPLRKRRTLIRMVVAALESDEVDGEATTPAPRGRRSANTKS